MVNLRSYLKQQMVDLEPQMLYTQIKPQSFLGSAEEDFVLPHMYMAAILFNGAEPFEKKLSIHLKQTAPCSSTFGEEDI